MDVEHLVEDVLAKWSQRGYIEPEMVGTIAADLSGEVSASVAGDAQVAQFVRGAAVDYANGRPAQECFDEILTALLVDS